MINKKTFSMVGGFAGLFIALAIFKPFMPKETPKIIDPFANGEYSKCILNEMPGAMNDAVAYAHIQKCASENRADLNDPPLGLPGMTPQECVIKYASQTTSAKGAGLISATCHHLYNVPPVDWSQFDNKK